jgi:hypothetical protein
MGGHRPDVVHVARLGDQIEQLASSSSAAARTPGSRRFLKGGVVAGTFSLHADPITDIASRLRGQQIDFAANEGGRPDRLRADPLPLAAVEGARTSGKVRCDNCHGTRKVTAR